MPLYSYKCPGCGHKEDVLRKLADYQLPQQCNNCADWMDRQISAPMVIADYAGYDCPITGDWIEGKKAHKENLARHGCRILEPGERESLSRRKQAHDEALDRSVEETAAQFVEALPSREKELLGTALDSGLDVNFVNK